MIVRFLKVCSFEIAYYFRLMRDMNCIKKWHKHSVVIEAGSG